MAKVENVTKEGLIKQQQQLKDEVTRLQKIIDASSETTFDIIIEDLKEQMRQNIEEEDWGEIKSCIKEVDNVNGTRKFIGKQASLLSKKKEELADVTDKIDNFQPSLFDDQEEETPAEEKRETTALKAPNNQLLYTGDIYKSNIPNAENKYNYYLVKKSSEKVGCFAIISNSFPEERLLQYPKNLDLLLATRFIGNRYEINGTKEFNDVSEAMNIINDGREKFRVDNKQKDEKDS